MRSVWRPTRMRIFSTFSKSWVKFVKAANEEVSDQAVEATRIVPEQDAESDRAGFCLAHS